WVTSGTSISYSAGNVGIGTTTPTAALHVNGQVKVNGANALELGGESGGEEPKAGKFGYQLFTPDARDIVGAGTGANRKVRFWAEGGTSFSGAVAATSFVGDGSGLTDVPSLWNHFASDISYIDGNVGIGTSTPTARLHVNGEVKVDGANAL